MASLRGVSDAHSDYRPQARDTAAVAERMQFDVWRRMTPAQKFAAFLDLQATVAALADAGIRLRYPHADAREVFLRRLARTLGRDRVRELYGFDAAEGD